MLMERRERGWRRVCLFWYLMVFVLECLVPAYENLASKRSVDSFFFSLFGFEDNSARGRWGWEREIGLLSWSYVVTTSLLAIVLYRTGPLLEALYTVWTQVEALSGGLSLLLASGRSSVPSLRLTDSALSCPRYGPRSSLRQWSSPDSRPVQSAARWSPTSFSLLDNT